MRSVITRIRKWIYPKISEKRRYPRKPINVKVTNKSSGFFSYFTSTNISIGGMFLKSEEPVPEGTQLSLEFTLPGSQEPLRVEAEVVRVAKRTKDKEITPGMGIQFKNLDKKQRQEIESFINIEL